MNEFRTVVNVKLRHKDVYLSLSRVIYENYDKGRKAFVDGSLLERRRGLTSASNYLYYPVMRVIINVIVVSFGPS